MQRPKDRYALPSERRIFLMLIFALLFLAVPALGTESSAATPTGNAQLKTVVIPVDGMVCFACAATIKRTVKSLGGVSSTEVSLEKRTVQVTYAADQLTPERIAAAINKLGYKAGAPRDAP
jgi:copper chaperone CopZ